MVVLWNLLVHVCPHSTEMLNVNNMVTTDLLSAYDEKADGKFDDDDLEAIQCGRPSKAVEDKLKGPWSCGSCTRQ